MPYGSMYAASEWQREHVVAMLTGLTVERGSLGGRISWTLWQSMQTATLVSPAARRLPCTLVWYSANWSVRRLGSYWRMRLGFEWHDPHKSGIFLRSILPLKPALLPMATVGS